MKSSLDSHSRLYLFSSRLYVMLPILDDMAGSMVLGSGPVLSRMAGMSAMDGTGEGMGDDISGKGVKTHRDAFPLCACCSSSICTLWTTFLSLLIHCIYNYILHEM